MSLYVPTVSILSKNRLGYNSYSAPVRRGVYCGSASEFVMKVGTAVSIIETI